MRLASAGVEPQAARLRAACQEEVCRQAPNDSGRREIAAELYYTFSTIAQALAAAMALLAAFALYPLQGVDTQCAGTAESLRQANVFSDLLVFAYASLHDWPRFLSAIKERDSGVAANRRLYEGVVALLPKLIGKAVAVQRAMWISLAVTAVMMAASVWMLAEVQWLCATGWATAALCGGVAGFIVCLAAYLSLLFIAFRKLPA